jgi:hypothetical protein
MIKPIRYTIHVAGAIAERKLKPEWIERVARQPEWMVPDPNDPEIELRYGTVAELSGRTIRVPVVETSTEIRIITAFLDRRPKRPRKP